ncbi:hypothetical protein ACFSR9_11965 [Deinococcus taklimakanensis]|uniref:Uncharacterized protein n=1 Tax=Deinococcus taklimakanensis TaxID=536443 RepID=A0ABW5P4T5_9DEIO
MNKKAEMVGHPKGTLEVFEDVFGNLLVQANGTDVTSQVSGPGCDAETLLHLAAELWASGMLKLR